VNKRGKAVAESDEDNECAVSMQAKKHFVCVLCGHVCLCTACADIIVKISPECPICRVLSTQIIKTFYSYSYSSGTDQCSGADNRGVGLRGISSTHGRMV